MDKYQILDTLPQQLGEEKQIELFKLFKQTQDEEIRNTLVVHNMKLAASVVQKYYGNTSIEFEDLFQIACIELVNAVEKFDPALGFSFSTFATISIKNRLVKPVVKAGNAIQTVSLEEPICDENNKLYDAGLLLSDVVPDYCESRIEEDFVTRETFLHIWKWVENKCSPIEIAVFEGICGINLPKSLDCDEIAKQLNISKQRVYEVRKSVRAKIRRKFFFEREIENI